MKEEKEYDAEITCGVQSLASPVWSFTEKVFRPLARGQALRGEGPLPLFILCRPWGLRYILLHRTRSQPMRQVTHCSSGMTPELAFSLYRS